MALCIRHCKDVVIAEMKNQEYLMRDKITLCDMFEYAMNW